MLLGLQFWAWFFCIIFIMSQCGNWNSLLYKFIFKTVAVSTKSKWNKRKQKYYKTAMLNWKTPISFYQTIIFVLGKCYAMVVFLKKEPCILISTLELSGASQLCLFLIFFKLSSQAKLHIPYLFTVSCLGKREKILPSHSYIVPTFPVVFLPFSFLITQIKQERFIAQLMRKPEFL